MSLTRTTALLLFLTACESETWVYAPSAEQRIVVEAGDNEIVGRATLTYDAINLPDADEIVGNALRMSVSSENGAALVLDFPWADEQDLGRFAWSSSLNLHEVYQPCVASCQVEVPFRITRSGAGADVLTITADALLSRASVLHVIDPESDAANLYLDLDRP